MRETKAFVEFSSKRRKKGPCEKNKCLKSYLEKESTVLCPVQISGKLILPQDPPLNKHYFIQLSSIIKRWSLKFV